MLVAHINKIELNRGELILKQVALVDVITFGLKSNAINELADYNRAGHINTYKRNNNNNNQKYTYYTHFILDFQVGF